MKSYIINSFWIARCVIHSLLIINNSMICRVLFTYFCIVGFSSDSSIFAHYYVVLENIYVKADDTRVWFRITASSTVAKPPTRFLRFLFDSRNRFYHL